MVYLIHFEEKLAHAQHYIGFTVHQDVAERFARHQSGQGSRLLAAVNQAGIAYEVVRTWPDGDRTFERKLKNQKKAHAFCPVCQAAKKIASPKKAKR